MGRRAENAKVTPEPNNSRQAPQATAAALHQPSAAAAAAAPLLPAQAANSCTPAQRQGKAGALLTGWGCGRGCGCGSDWRCGPGSGGGTCGNESKRAGCKWIISYKPAELPRRLRRLHIVSGMERCCCTLTALQPVPAMTHAVQPCMQPCMQPCQKQLGSTR